MNKVELLVIQNASVRGLIVCLKPNVPFVLTPSLTHEIRNMQDVVAGNYCKSPWSKPLFIVWYLHTGRIPWKGLDFTFIHQALVNHKEKMIESYLNEVFDLLFLNYIGSGFPIINCSIITRPLSGISQDFFYLNHINFIKTRKKIENQPISKLYHKMDVPQVSDKLYFPEALYARNEFYGFHAINYSRMKRIVATKKFEPVDIEKQLEIKEIFNQTKKDTLTEIYEIASRNIKILDRLSKQQVIEHARLRQSH